MLDSISDSLRRGVDIGLSTFGGVLSRAGSSCAGSLTFLFSLEPPREPLLRSVALPLRGESSLQGDSSLPGVELSFVEGSGQHGHLQRFASKRHTLLSRTLLCFRGCCIRGSWRRSYEEHRYVAKDHWSYWLVVE